MMRRNDPFAFAEDVLKQFAVRALENNYLNTLWGFALGKRNIVSKDYGIGLGVESSVEHYAGLGFSGGMFAQVGDAQETRVVVQGQTSGAVTVGLLLANGDSLSIPALSAWAFTVRLVGKRTDGSAKGACYVFHGGCRRDGTVGSASLMGAVVNPLAVDEFGGAVSILVKSGALVIECTGVVGYAINWVAVVEITQTKAL